MPGASCQTQKSGTKQERIGESVTMTLVSLLFIAAVNNSRAMVLSDRYNFIIDGGNISDSALQGSTHKSPFSAKQLGITVSSRVLREKLLEVRLGKKFFVLFK